MTKSSAGFPTQGEVFEGRYRIEATIGTGGFARVYRAKQEDLGRDVAIKVLIPAAIDDGTATYPDKLVRRFNQEAKLVSRLQDPNTITMYDYGRTDNGMLYMVFEFVDGESVSELVERVGALDYKRVISIVAQTLSSLEEAHAFGVMHRDIKPGNIMVFDHIGRTDRVKLLDFGIAKVQKAAGSQSKDLTADGTLIGTPRYMSPEQIRGEEITPRSDIYSLGLVAFEMLVGSKAIAATSSVTIIGLQLDPRPFRIPPEIEVSDGVRYIVEKMMSKDPNHRYQDTREVLLDIENVDSLASSSSSDASDSVDSIEFVPPARKKPAWLIAIAGAILFGIAGVAVAVTMVSNEARSEPDTKSVAVKTIEGTEQEFVDETTVVVEEKKIGRLHITSVPPGAPVSINGTAFGSTPIHVAEDRVTFPAEISIETNGQTHKKTLISFQGEVAFDLDARKVAQNEKVVVKKKPRKKRVDPKRDRPPRKVQPDPRPPELEEKIKPVFVPMDVTQ